MQKTKITKKDINQKTLKKEKQWKDQPYQNHIVDQKQKNLHSRKQAKQTPTINLTDTLEGDKIETDDSSQSIFKKVLIQFL